MKIGVLSGFPFPVGYAGSNRVVSMSKGLYQNEADVTNYIFKPTEHKNNIINEEAKGCIDGVNYIYPCGTTIRKKNKIFNFIYKLYSIFKTLKYINKENKNNPLDILIIYNDYPFILYIFTQFLKVKKIFLAVDEYPPEMRYKYKDQINRTNRKIYQICLNKIVGIVSMTQELIHYFNEINKKETKSIVIPMSVEPDRFTEIEKTNGEEYLAYIGNFDNIKDGIDILINSFNIIQSKHENIKLYMAGEGSSLDMEKARNLIKKLNLENRIKLLGRLHRNDVPKYLTNAKILCLSRPWTKRSAAGIPTKLGEYLCSGVPTITTKVGELTEYLKDKIDCQIVEPDNPKKFAERISYMLNNYEESLIIAEKGKQVANTAFNNNYQGKQLVNFFNTVLN